MNAGKTTVLLGSAHNYEENNKQILLLNSVLDNRFGEHKIASRIGISKPCISYSKDTDIYDIIISKTPLDCVFIDEAQFLTREQVWSVMRAVQDFTLNVKCFGLRTNFKGDLFEGSETLLAISDELVNIKTICFCGKIATMNHLKKKGNSDVCIQIGGNDMYESLCFFHWSVKNLKSELM